MSAHKNDHTGEWYASDNPEHYCIGLCETKEQAIQEFKDEHEGREPTHIGQAAVVYCQVSGESVIEQIENSLCDELYEDALDGWCRGVSHGKINELSEKLTKVFHEWLDEVDQDICWNVIHEVQP